MKPEQLKKANSIFEKFKSNAKEEDVEKISGKIFDMNKGPLKKIWNTVMQLWALVKDKDAAWSAKAIAIAALLYVVSPIDAIPDVIPVLGLVDDAAIVGLAVKMLGDALKVYEMK